MAAYSFAVNLVDGVSGNAKSMAGAMGGLKGAITSVAGAVSGAVDGITSAFKSLASGDVKGAITDVTHALSGMAQTLDLLVPGLGQVASTLISVGGGFAALAAGVIESGAKMALSATETRARMVSLFDALGEGKVSGVEMVSLLDSLTGKLGATREELAPLAQKFMTMGITDIPKLTEALTAARSAVALVGDEGGAAFTTLEAKIQNAIASHQGLKIAAKAQAATFKEMGLSITDVAKQMGIPAEALAKSLKAGTEDVQKFGDAVQNALIEKGKGPLDQLAGSFSVLRKDFEANISHMFENVDTKPFTEALKSFGTLFDENANSGKVFR